MLFDELRTKHAFYFSLDSIVCMIAYSLGSHEQCRSVQQGKLATNTGCKSWRFSHRFEVGKHRVNHAMYVI